MIYINLLDTFRPFRPTLEGKLDGSLLKIYIPSSVTTIVVNPFSGCPASLRIYGQSGSTAESFANSNGYTFIPVVN